MYIHLAIERLSEMRKKADAIIVSALHICIYLLFLSGDTLKDITRVYNLTLKLHTVPKTPTPSIMIRIPEKEYPENFLVA